MLYARWFRFSPPLSPVAVPSPPPDFPFGMFVYIGLSTRRKGPQLNLFRLSLDLAGPATRYARRLLQFGPGSYPEQCHAPGSIGFLRR